MINYILINIMLTAGALLINSLMQIPHRTRFYILLIALIGWITPFGLMTIELPGQALPEISSENFLITSQQVISNVVIPSNFNWQLLISWLIMAGVIRFGIDLLVTSKRIKSLSNKSRPCTKNPQIRYAKNVNGAFVSGYFKPIIWIDEQHENTEEIHSIITHEQQHISSHDQFWLLLITLIQRLFWFNPLVYILSIKTRHSIELSCDEACKQQMSQQQYQNHLAQLLTLAPNQPSKALLNNQVSQSKNFNIHRIKQLEINNTMNKKQKIKLTTTITLIGVLCLYSLITFADDNPISGLKAGQVYIELRITDGTQATKELSLNVSNQELAEVRYDSYQLSIKPTIIFPPKHSAEKGEIQIINEIIFSKINSDHSQTVITSPSLLVSNQNWAGIKVNDDTNNEQIHIEVRPTVKNWVARHYQNKKMQKLASPNKVGQVDGIKLSSKSTSQVPVATQAPVPASPTTATTAPAPPAIQLHNTPPQPSSASVPVSPPKPVKPLLTNNN